MAPDVGRTIYNDISESELNVIQTTAVLQLDDILNSHRYSKPVKLRRPKTISAGSLIKTKTFRE